MKLLLIEDDLQLGNALLRGLKQENFPCVWVRSLAGGRDQIASNPSDIIILDVNLPDGEGFDLLIELRKKGDRTPIIIMTARDALNDRLNGLDNGADDYITKPFSVYELIARIRAVSRRAAGFATQIWNVGNISLDSQARTVKVSGNVIELTPREFNMLIELMRSAGRVVVRSDLVDRVWGYAETPTDSALEFQIHSLRKKIGADHIRTVRGVGYVLTTS